MLWQLYILIKWSYVGNLDKGNINNMLFVEILKTLVLRVSLL